MRLTGLLVLLATVAGEMVDVTDKYNAAAAKQTATVHAANLANTLLDRFGNTELYTAAFKGKLKLIGQLLDDGADINGVGHQLETAAHAAVLGKQVAAIKLLAKRGIDLNQRGRNAGHAPIHYAAEGRSSKMLKALLELGADVNALDTYHHSALHIAAGKGRIESVKLLLAKNIDTTVAGKGDEGDTAERMARDTGNVEIMKLIQSHEDKSLKRLGAEYGETNTGDEDANVIKEAKEGVEECSEESRHDDSGGGGDGGESEGSDVGGSKADSHDEL